MDEHTWRTVAGFLDDDVRRKSPGNARRYLRSGMACGVCADQRTTVNTGGTRHRVRLQVLDHPAPESRRAAH